MIILGLGSNIGDRQRYLAEAVRRLSAIVQDMRISGIFESQAVLPQDAPAGWNRPYLNMAISGKAEITPEELLSKIKTIENEMGRISRGHWGPREIDIDILAMGDTVMNSPELTLPHRELLNRNFALLPLAEVAREWLYPVPGPYQGKTAMEIINAKGYRLNDKLQPWQPSFGTKLVGIVNVTPDSFSDGGKHYDPGAAIDAIGKLVDEGADVIDIGAESTRPGATPITAEEEWKRLEPVLVKVSHFFPLMEFSIDTRHAQTAKHALGAGVHWINDVSGFSDPAMVEAVKDSDCKLVVMHSLTVPADKNVVMPEGTPIVPELIAWGKQRIADLQVQGIARERIIFDPGIGFGKTAKQSWQIINDADKLKAIGVPILIGHSRKSFLNAEKAKDKDTATLLVSRQLAMQGIDYLRVHDVASHSYLFKQHHD